MTIMSFPQAVEEASGLQNVLDGFAYDGEIDWPSSGWAPTWREETCPSCFEADDVAQLHDVRTFTDVSGWLHCCRCDITWPEVVAA